MRFTLPTITLNGTDPEVLRDLHLDARHKVREALYALKLCHPNGRDYPSCGTLDSATIDHVDMEERLKAIASYLFTVADHCDNVALIGHPEFTTRKEPRRRND